MSLTDENECATCQKEFSRYKPRTRGHLRPNNRRVKETRLWVWQCLPCNSMQGSRSLMGWRDRIAENGPSRKLERIELCIARLRQQGVADEQMS